MTINGIEYKKPVLVFALESEAGAEFENFERIFTGIGKVNATYSFLKYLQSNTPDLIINLGTAGGFGFEKGEVVCCTKFIQRDMDVRELGFELYQTPLSDDPVILDYGLKINGLHEEICGTGDHFETAHSTDAYQVVDMEAYALALVAQRENIPFLCLKYISDGADDAAASDWTEEVIKAAKKLKEVLFKEPQMHE